MLGSSGTTGIRRRVNGLVLAGLLVAGTACGNHGATSHSSAKASTESFVSILRRLGEGFDYDTHVSPEALGKEATLTVIGTVESVADGRVFGAGPTRDTEPVFLNATLTVRVEDVLAGDASLVRDGRVYVELARTKVTPVASFQSAIPTDHRVVLFLDDYSRGPGTFPLIEKAPSIPAGATVFAPYADGFLIEDSGSGKLVGGYEPLDAQPPAWREGIASLTSFTGTHFPGA